MCAGKTYAWAKRPHSEHALIAPRRRRSVGPLSESSGQVHGDVTLAVAGYAVGSLESRPRFAIDKDHVTGFPG